MAENNEAKTRLIGQQIQKGKGRTHTKQMDMSDIDDNYVGTFKFHHPSLMERMNIGVVKAQMIQGLEGRVDVLTDNIAHMSATLENVLDEFPEWFQMDQVLEYEVLERVYEEYIQWYNSFRKPSGKSDTKKNSGKSSK